MTPHLNSFACVLFATAALQVTQAAENQGDNQLANQQREPSPKQTVANFFGHLSEGEIVKAKKLLFMPIKDPRVAPKIDVILQQIAKRRAKNFKVHVFDSHELKDMAIVVYGREGPRFTDNIDIDPVFLRIADRQWKIVFANSADALKKHELTDDALRKRADELLKWFEKRQKEVRSDWRKKQEK